MRWPPICKTCQLIAKRFVYISDAIFIFFAPLYCETSIIATRNIHYISYKSEWSRMCQVKWDNRNRVTKKRKTEEDKNGSKVNRRGKIEYLILNICYANLGWICYWLLCDILVWELKHSFSTFHSVPYFFLQAKQNLQRVQFNTSQLFWRGSNTKNRVSIIKSDDSCYRLAWIVLSTYKRTETRMFTFIPFHLLPIIQWALYLQ